MLAALIEAAIRSLILALAVWAGLRVFRIHSVISQRFTWTAVLIGSLLMPFALPFTSHWHVLSFASIPAPASLDHLQSEFANFSSTPTPAVAPSSGKTLASAPQLVLNAPQAARAVSSYVSAFNDSLPAHSVPATNAVSPQTLAARSQISLLSMAVLAYFFIAGVLLFRLLFGLMSAMYLWHKSTPIPPVTDVPFGADLTLRWTHKVSAPVTIGSGIVLPADYRSWTEEKIRIVLAHERSHVSQHDFHLQILASLYAALAWFSPLGWWLKHKLSDLGEAISDRSGLDAASNRSAYAQVLLEFAAAPRPTLIGVAMARPNSISRRIDRLLNDGYLRHAFSGSVRSRLAVLIVPIALFTVTAFVQVQAASQASFRSANAYLQDAASAPAQPDPAVAQVPAAPAAPAGRVIPATAIALEYPGGPATPATPATPDSPSASAQDAAPPAPPSESQATFDRNLSFTGKLALLVSTGAGDITLTKGSANQIHIHGIVKAGRNGDPAQVQQIASNPPIEQDGNTIRIGGHQENLHNISISYEIEAPADTMLNAATGSGNITDTGVGQEAKLSTGSGNITATGIDDGFRTETGSGNIAIDGTGQGDARAQTGSGNIDLKGVHGALEAQTGSGAIKAAGTPSSPWKLQSGSGSIELSTGNAPMDLDASVRSGTMLIHFEKVTQTAATPVVPDRHHVHTQLNGGGPEVRVETGSGNIRVD